MNALRRRGTAAAISVLTLLAVAGWLQLLLGVRDTPAPVDGEALSGVIRAGLSVERLAETPTDAVAARRTQADLVAAISLVPRLSDDASRAELDALLIRALDAVQRLNSPGSEEGVTDAGEILAGVAAGIDSEVTEMVAAQSIGARQGLRSTMGIAGLVLSIAAAVGALLLVVGRRSDIATAVDAATAGPGSRASVRHAPASVSSSREGKSPPAPALPPGVLDSADFHRALEREQSRSARYGHELSLMTVALVEPNMITQHHGTDALEYVIGSVAELARDNTRASDLVGVNDSNQVVVLLSETAVEDAEHAAAKLRRSVEMFPFSDNITPTISTSCTDAAKESR